MSASVYFRQALLATLLLASTFAFAQTNSEKIKAKWIVEKYEVEKNAPEALKAKQDLQGVCLTFGNEELVISRKTGTGDSILKKGPYLISGNKLSLGEGKADILLSENKLTISIPGQGVLYLTKM